MNQSRKSSLLESITNVTVGYAVAVLTQILVFPLFDMQTTMGDNLQIAFLFTVVSLIRSYTLRRIFTNIRSI